MKKQLVFEGVATALVTPMDSGGRIEKALFQELLEMQVQSGIDAVEMCIRDRVWDTA